MKISSSTISNSKKVNSVAVVGPTLLEWSTVESIIGTYGTHADKREKKFQLFILHSLFNLSSSEAEYHITDEGHDRGIDCIFFDFDKKIINLINTKTVVTFEKSRSNFPGNEVDKIITFLEEFLTRNASLLDTVNLRLKNKIVEAWDLLIDPDYKVDFFIISNQASLCTSERNRLVGRFPNPKLAFHEKHLGEIANGVTRRISKQISKDVNFCRGLYFEYNIGTTARVFGGIIAASELCKIVSDETGNFIEPNLFASNVRFDLGSDNEINKSIRATLMSNNNNEFICLNNGITIVCDQVINSVGTNFPFRLVNPQIVNGCQTAHAIVDVYRSNPGHVGKIAISVKIIESSDEEFTDRIAVATNSQTRIFPRDLRANCPRQITLSQGIKALGHFYKRKKGEVYSGQKNKEIDSLKTGQLILAYLLGEPDKAKTRSDAVFDDLYDAIFDPKVITPELVIQINKIYDEVLSRKRIAFAIHKKSFNNSYEEQWIIEGAFHVLYALGEICRRNNINLMSQADVNKKLDDAVIVVAEFYDSNKQAAYRLFRSARSKDEILKIIDRDFINSLPSVITTPIQLEFRY